MSELDDPNHRSRVAALRREKMHGHLLETGLLLVSRQGAEGFSIDDVVKQAQVARGTFYKYFSNPADLVRAVALQLADEVRMAVNAQVRLQTDPALRAAMGMRGVLRLVRACPELGAFIIRAGWPVSEPSHAFFNTVAPNIDEGQASGRFRISHREIALSLIGGLTVGAIHSMLTQELPDDFPEGVAQTLLAGLGLADSAELARQPMWQPPFPQTGLLGRLSALCGPK